jgi:hypothetical protein
MALLSKKTFIAKTDMVCKVPIFKKITLSNIICSPDEFFLLQKNHRLMI